MGEKGLNFTFIFRYEANRPPGAGLCRDEAAGRVQGVADQAEHEEGALLSDFLLEQILLITKSIYTCHNTNI